MSTGTVSRSGWWLIGRELVARHHALRRLLAWTVVEALPSLLSGLLVAAALDRGFLAGRPLVGLMWLLAYAASIVVKAEATRRTFPWLADLVEPMRDALVRKVVSATLRRVTVGDELPDNAVVARLTSQVETVRSLVGAQLRTLRLVVINLIAALVGLAALTPVLAGLVAVPLLIAVGLFMLSLRSLARRERSVIIADEDLARRTTQLAAGIRDLVANTAEPEATKSVEVAVEAQAAAVLARSRFGMSRLLVVALGGQVPILAVLIAGPWLVRSGHLSVGQVAGAITYLTTSLGPGLQSFISVIGGWGLSLGAVAHRIYETTQEPAPVSAGVAIPQRTELTLDGITFAYAPTSEPVVADLTLRIAEGEHLAVVGPSGAGKSTLANIFMAVLQPQRGTVFIGDVPIREVDKGWLRTSLALIPQEAYVFVGTLRENLTYLRPDATESQIRNSVDALGAAALVDRLGGYEAQMGGDGTKLSAGERQLLALTRVHLSTAQIVILDEASCHLDASAEALVERAFSARSGTLIVIAHRISSAQRAQHVLLLDGAKPVLGTHDSLLNTSRLYADLVGHWQASVA